MTESKTRLGVSAFATVIFIFAFGSNGVRYLVGLPRVFRAQRHTRGAKRHHIYSASPSEISLVSPTRATVLVLNSRHTLHPLERLPFRVTPRGHRPARHHPRRSCHRLRAQLARVAAHTRLGNALAAWHLVRF